MLASWDQALRETKATASHAARVLRVGFMSSAADEATQQIIAAFARCRPGWRVDLQQAAWWRDLLAGHQRTPGPPGPHRIRHRQPDAWLTAIANGYGIALAPESAARYYARPGITYRPVTGVSPSQAGVAWPPANDTDPVVQDFVRCCLDNKPAAHLKNQPDQQ